MTTANTTTSAFTDRHKRQLRAIQECSKTAGPNSGESVPDWVQRRFREIMRDHLDQRIAERESEA